MGIAITVPEINGTQRLAAKNQRQAPGCPGGFGTFLAKFVAVLIQ